MAAGLLTIAHRSGGPLMDIITEEAGTRNGFLAVTAQEYAAHIAFIISMTEEVSGREKDFLLHIENGSRLNRCI